MVMIRPNDEYYIWLCDMIGVNQEDNSYWLLIGALNREVFEYSVPNDDNREADGLELRNQFLSETNRQDPGHEFFDAPCTMLEMLIGLAIRCEYIMDAKSVADWFWVMLDNAGLSKFTDEAFIEENGPHNIHHIVERIVLRTYHKTGVGGLFPLHHHKKDQRKVELWYQMSDYLSENYYQKDEFHLK